MKILISDAFDPSLPGRLEKFGEVTDDKGQVGDANVVLVRSKTKCTKDYIDNAPGLKLIIRGGVGIDNIDTAYAKEKGIEVRNTPAASSIAVAELAFTLMIALPNHVIKGHNGMRDGNWLKKECKRTELYKKTLGLIGLGRIGLETAKRAKAFGMDVIAYDVVKSDQDVAKYVELDELLARADYISLHLPLTDDTKGMVNKDLIAGMKDGVYIVNTGRGKTVNEADVADALKSGKIAGYGNDVWYSDPPESTPLTDAPNVVLLPHIGASTKENLLRIGDIIVEIIEEFVAKNK
ncbi:MAG: NAD(P)-dependent oxidoreductase [Planctomycetota bacterium]|jgi:D-3-phosphoglycerate dehydrogenase